MTTDGLQSVFTVLDGAKARTITTTVSNNPAAQTRYVFIQGSAGSAKTNTYQQGRLVSSYRYAGTNCIGGEVYAYDPHGLVLTVTDTHTGTVTSNTYTNADLLSQETLNAASLPAQSTGFDYDARGRLAKVTLPDGLSAANVYSEAGLLRTNTGARTYPAQYGYDAQGRLTTLTTWTNTAAVNSATTTWGYDSNTGFLSSKNYQGASGPTFDFTPAGRLKTRVSARNVTTTYTTNVAGRVAVVNYSDTTPDLGFTYTRQGRVATVTTNGATAATRTHTGLGLLASETQGGVTVSYGYNSLLQLEAVNAVWSGTNLAGASYQYDGASRLTGVSFGSFSASYSYWPNSSLVSNLVFKSGANVRMTTSRNYDTLNRLAGIISAPSASSAVSFHYGYNQANQRMAVTNADNSRWEYQYDYLGQLTNAVRKWSDGSLVAGQQFGYAFDQIGNRRSTTRDTRTGGNTVNLLNQVTGRINPGFANILGTATNSATVTVNYQATERKGEYFRKELYVINSGGAVWLGVTNIAVLSLPTNDLLRTNIGSLFVPPYSESLQYDADGNLTNDGQWSYVWDAENRLISQETTAPAVARGVPKQKLLYGYDWMSRRVSKTVSNWTGSAWTLGYDHRFIYDGWNLLAILDAPSATRLASFTWGNDLSGTRQGAGGIGGLLAMTVHSGTNAGTYFYIYDGNGNVAGLLDAQSSTLVATYEHGAFGELLRATGPLAFLNPFRFSTKYYDDETGNYYYGYRYYSPVQGRWLSRDPIGENGGLSLYGFALNNPLIWIDPLGLDVGDWCNFWTWTLPSMASLEGKEKLDQWAMTQPWNKKEKFKSYQDALLRLNDKDSSGMEAAFALHQSRCGDVDSAREITKDFAEAYLNSPTPPLKAVGVVATGTAAIEQAGRKGGFLERFGKLFRKEGCAARSGVWRLGEMARGTEIERLLAKTDYKDWFYVGKLDKGRFPLVDFQKGNNLVSLKTVDTTGSTWLSRMQEHIDDLGSRGATVNGNPANMILDLRVQPGGAAAAQSLVPYGEKYGVTVTVKEFP